MPTPNKPKEDLSFLDTKNDNAKGFEQIDNSTMSVPFLRIAQALSPQLKSNKPEYIAGLEQGHMFNTVSKEVYGQSMKLIVIAFEHMYTEWKPNRGGFVGAHTVENAMKIGMETVEEGRRKFKTKDGNDLTEQYTFIVLNADAVSEGPMVLSLTSSNIGVAKGWNRNLISKKLPNGEKALPFYSIWDISTIEASNDQGDWYKINVDWAGWVNKDQYAVTRDEKKLLPDRTVDYAQIDTTKEETEDKPGPGQY